MGSSGKTIPRPKRIFGFLLKLIAFNLQAIVFGIITNKKFDMIIMGFIMLNMIAMMCDHFNMSNAWKFALDNANLG